MAKFVSSVADADMTLESSPSQPQVITQVITQYPKINPVYATLIAGVAFLVCFLIATLGNSAQQGTSYPPSTSHQTISGKITHKGYGQGGAVRYKLYNASTNNHYTVIVTADVWNRGQWTPGTTISVKGNHLGDNAYTVSSDTGITEITTVVDYHVLKHVRVKNNKAFFEYAGGVTSIWVDQPDGYYSQMVVAKDSQGKIQVLTATL